MICALFHSKTVFFNFIAESLWKTSLVLIEVTLLPHVIIITWFSLSSVTVKMMFAALKHAFFKMSGRFTASKQLTQTDSVDPL